MSSSSESRRKIESTSSTGPNQRRYNVFLSFFAPDVRQLVPRLDKALRSEAGIVVFGEDEKRVKSALNVIRQCKIAIVVFSENYANSSLCIQELKKITECARTSDLIVFPVFYYGTYYPERDLKESSMFGEAFNGFLYRINVEEVSKEGDICS